MQAEEPKKEEVVVDPYCMTNSSGAEIDYDVLIKKFGCSPITPALLEKMAALTQQPVHRFLRREIFFS